MWEGLPVKGNLLIYSSDSLLQFELYTWGRFILPLYHIKLVHCICCADAVSVECGRCEWQTKDKIVLRWYTGTRMRSQITLKKLLKWLMKWRISCKAGKFLSCSMIVAQTCICFWILWIVLVLENVWNQMKKINLQVLVEQQLLVMYIWSPVWHLFTHGQKDFGVDKVSLWYWPAHINLKLI